MEYYSHTIYITNFNNIDIFRLENILKTGYLFSRRILNSIFVNYDINISEKTALFNGMDYISLCDLSKVHEEYSAYNMYFKNGLSLLFDRNIDVVIPLLIKERIGELFSCNNVHDLGMGLIRYSDLSDEVQVKDKLSIEHLHGISLSINRFLHFHSEKYLIDYLKWLKYVLTKYEKNIPIINIDNYEEISLKKNKYLN